MLKLKTFGCNVGDVIVLPLGVEHVVSGLAGDFRQLDVAIRKLIIHEALVQSYTYG